MTEFNPQPGDYVMVANARHYVWEVFPKSLLVSKSYGTGKSSETFRVDISTVKPIEDKSRLEAMSKRVHTVSREFKSTSGWSSKKKWKD